MHFVAKSQIPTDKIVTYAQIVCDYRPLKSEPNRTHLTVVGDRLIYRHYTSTDAADLGIIKYFLTVHYLNLVRSLFLWIAKIFSRRTIHLFPQTSCVFISILYRQK